MATAWPAAAGRPCAPAAAPPARPTGQLPRSGTWAATGVPATTSGRPSTPDLGRNRRPPLLPSPRGRRTATRAGRDGRDLSSDDFYLAEPAPSPPPLAVTEAGGARLWEADLPTPWDIACGTPRRRFIPTAPGEAEDDDLDNLDWAAAVRDWPRFWALYAAWKFHLDARRFAPPKKEARAAPRKRPQAAWERAMGFSPPDEVSGGAGGAPLPPLAAQHLEDLRRARGEEEAEEEEEEEGPAKAAAAAAAAALPGGGPAGAPAGAPGGGGADATTPDIARLSKPTSASALAAAAFWKDDGAFQAAIDKAVRIVHKQVPALLAAGVPVPEALPAYDAERSSHTLFHDDPAEGAWESRWRQPRDAISPPPPPPPLSPYDGWTGVEVRAWAAKRAAHDAADAAFAVRQARVGAFREADVSEHSDVRMRRAVAAVPGFKFNWSHEEIMAVITNGGLSVHPDDAAAGVGVVDPLADPDYWEEGIHQEPPLEEFLDGLGRLAGPGTRGPPELADPEAYGVGGPDGVDGGVLVGGLPPDLAAEAAAAAAAAPESMSGMRTASGRGARGNSARGGGGAPAAASDDDDDDDDPLASSAAAASATLDEPFADFDLGGGGGGGGGIGEGEGGLGGDDDGVGGGMSDDDGGGDGPTLDPAGEARPAGYEDDDGEEG